MLRNTQISSERLRVVKRLLRTFEVIRGYLRILRAAEDSTYRNTPRVNLSLHSLNLFVYKRFQKFPEIRRAPKGPPRFQSFLVSPLLQYPLRSLEVLKVSSKKQKKSLAIRLKKIFIVLLFHIIL